MQRKAVHFIAASLLLSGASLIQAQPEQPAHLMRIFREDIKSGKGAAHEKVESAYVRAFSKTAYPSYLALVSLSGTSQAWFLERYDSYASLQKAIDLTSMEPLKSQLAPLDAQDGELRSGDRGIIATFQRDSSYQPVPANLAMMRYVTVSVVRIRPGHAAEFTEMRKVLNAAWTKQDNKQRRVIYSVNSGMPAGTYLIFSGMETLAAMDPQASAMPMGEALGEENAARYRKLQSEIVISTESTLFTVNPRMSNPPKEYITASPDFWAPKPKLSASKAPAKPAPQQ